MVWVFASVAATAREPVHHDRPLRRAVLALHDSQGERRDLDTEDPAHRLLELPLNHLGMVVRRHDIRKGPPPDDVLTGLRAVITYFHDTGASAPEWLWPWLEKTRQEHAIRVIHFGHFGPLLRPRADRYDPARVTRWLKGFGLQYDDLFLPGPMGIKVEYRDRRLCAYEANARMRTSHHGPRNVDPQNRVWVTTRPTKNPEDARTPVVTGSWGAIALDPWTITAGGGSGNRRWHLDPLMFFREALGLEHVPAPQPAVLNGRRMLFLQVGGSGFESISTVQRNTPNAQVFLNRIIEEYELPFTVGVVVASLTDDYAISEPTPEMLLAQRILNHPRVEAASHTVLQPLRWNAPLLPDSPPRSVVRYPPIRNYEYSPVAEVRESLRFINERLLLKGKRCRLMLWSGLAVPPPEAVEESARLAVGNLNGGIYRWDASADSIGYVSPWARRVGDRVQVYAGAPNENAYDGFFDTMPQAYGHVGTTLERTGRHGILKPVHINVHFYSAENAARLATLEKVIQRWAVEEPTAPVFASTYVKAVRDALLRAHIVRKPQGWAFRFFGACRTVRIDGETRSVDWARSRGLLGQRRMRGALYLHLAASDAEVVLANDPPPQPHVEQANHILEGAVLEPDRIAVSSSALTPRRIVFAGFAPRAKAILSLDGETQAVQADGHGRIELQLPSGEDRVEVRLP